MPLPLDDFSHRTADGVEKGEGDGTRPLFDSFTRVSATGVPSGLICVSLSTWAAAQENALPPDFSSNHVGWLTFNVDFSIVPGGTSPLHNDAAYPRVSNEQATRTGKQPNYFLGISRAPQF
jgi:hypothetical protein